MTEFSGAVREALAAIPHGASCPAREPATVIHRKSAPDVTWTFVQGPCDCDREERIAQRVAAALELLAAQAADESAGQSSHMKAVYEQILPSYLDEALAALRGEVYGR